MSIKKAEIDGLLDRVPDIGEKPLSFDDYVEWFEREVAKRQDGDQSQQDMSEFESEEGEEKEQDIGDNGLQAVRLV